jgi:hypothetical protein
MARFRHLHAADENGLEFDWKPHSKGTEYRAGLENGDFIFVTPWPSKKWGHEIYGPVKHWTDPAGKAREVWTHLGGSDEFDSFDGEGKQTYLDPHDSMRAAEAHYKTLDRRGVTPPAQEYDINDIMRNFGKGDL